MAGMEVVVVKTAADGTVDFDDLRGEDRQARRPKLAVIMITYPSTHGVYESRVAELCAQGARRRRPGLCRRREHERAGRAGPSRAFGADVSHLNLHKTFAIPHGGGGPGRRPGGGARAPGALPAQPPARPDAGPVTSYGPVSAAPFGSAGVLPITYGVHRDDGAGAAAASQVAVLAANYLASSARPAVPDPLHRTRRLVAHECIVDLRPLTKETGVTVDDVAKRLIDYGFHAPTMSFPVAGTLMVEPTESESLAELDRFVEAMLPSPTRRRA
jgi:glycine dehydrogenase